MNGAFVRILHNAITAGWIVLILVALRPLLRKASARVRAALWAAVALRLLSPISIESALSPIPDMAWDAKTLSAAAEASAAYTEGTAFSPITGAWIVWLVGACLLLSFALVRTLLLRRRVRASIRQTPKIYLCDDIKEAFVLGIFVPKIYLPSGMDAETQSLVLAHERAHISRGDPVKKAIAYLLLCVYWFQPLLWLSYLLFCRDLEFACDEKTVRAFDPARKASYCETLVRCASDRTFRLRALPFGAAPIKARVRAVLRERKPSRLCGAVGVCIGVLSAICFLTVPKTAIPAPFPDLTREEQLYGTWKLDRMDYRDHEGDRLRSVQQWMLDSRLHITFLPDNVVEVCIRPGTKESVMTYEVNVNQVTILGREQTDARSLPTLLQIRYDPQTDSLSYDVRSLVSETYTRADAE